jgi:hypothetical protein
VKLSEKTSKPKDCRHDDHKCHLEALKNDEFGGPQLPSSHSIAISIAKLKIHPKKKSKIEICRGLGKNLVKIQEHTKKNRVTSCLLVIDLGCKVYTLSFEIASLKV